MSMTDEERKMLHDLHRALLGVPTGSPDDTEPVLTRVNRMLSTYERGSWVLRITVITLSTLAGIAVAIETIKKAWPW